MVALSNCMVIGDKRKYLAMLVSLKTEINMETGAPLDKLAADSLFVGKSIGSSAVTVGEVSQAEKLKFIELELEEGRGRGRNKEI